MSFALSPPVPPNIPEDKVYSINDFNDYFDQLQKIVSSHDDALSDLVTGAAGYFPFKINPATINTQLDDGIYYITSTAVSGTFPFTNLGNGCFLISVKTGTTSTQFMFDYSGIYVRRSVTALWTRIAGSAIINSLTSTSTTDSLSANQGRILNEKKIDQYIHTSSDSGTTNIDNLLPGVHTFIDAKVSGTFPSFSPIISRANKFIIESFGVSNTLVFQKLINADGIIVGTRVGVLFTDALGDKYWQWSDWEEDISREIVQEMIDEIEIGEQSYNFYCVKGEQEVTLQPGVYDVDCYGAQGGGYIGPSTEAGKSGGLGTHASARFTVTKPMTLYAYVGEHPTTALGGFPFAGSVPPGGGAFAGKGFGGGGCSFLSLYKLPDTSDTLLLNQEFAAIVPAGTTKTFNLGIASSTTMNITFRLPSQNHWKSCTEFYITANGNDVRQLEKSDASGENVSVTLTGLPANAFLGLRVTIASGHSDTYTSPLYGTLSGSVLTVTYTGGTTITPADTDLFTVGDPLICAGGGGGASSNVQGAVAGQLSLTTGKGAGQNSTNIQYGAGGSGKFGGKAATSAGTPGGGGTNFISASVDGITISNAVVTDNIRRNGDGWIKITLVKEK